MKDNIAVGGVPLMNGSAVLDGYVPEQDATVVARVLAAGATIAGKAVCEALCYSGSSHTSDTGPVLNPVRSPPFERRLVERLRRAPRRPAGRSRDRR